ncbi:MAG: hypothetical protein II747_07690 [Clostridia bacterium]|nr:hypothetical protein [Clostridia bacterium]
MDGYSFKRLIRKPWLSIAGFVVAGAMCFLLCVLSNYRSEQEMELDWVSKNYEVIGHITDRNGTRSEHLRLGKRYVSYITDAENGLAYYARDLRLTKEFSAIVDQNSDSMLYGVTNERCDACLDKAYGGDYYSDVPNFYNSADYNCLVSEELYNRYKNGTMSIVVFDPYAKNLETGIESMEIGFKVVGWHKGNSSKVFIPFPAAMDIGERMAGSVSVDSASFVLKDNSKVDEVYKAAEKLFPKVDPNETNPGYALTIRDQQYKATITSIEQNIARTGYLLPIISLLGLAAGFLAGFLGTKGETRNYALMRTMGLTGARLFVTVLFEQQVLSLLACIIVAFITGRPLPSAAFFLCNMVGTALAVLKPVLAPPTKLLRDQQ